MNEKKLEYDTNGDIVSPFFEDWTIEEKILLLREIQTEQEIYIDKRRTLHIEIEEILFKLKNKPEHKGWDIIKERDETESGKFILSLMKYPDDEVRNQRFENYSDNFRKISQYFDDLATFFDNASYYDKIIAQLEVLQKAVKQDLKIW